MNYSELVNVYVIISLNNRILKVSTSRDLAEGYIAGYKNCYMLKIATDITPKQGILSYHYANIHCQAELMTGRVLKYSESLSSAIMDTLLYGN